MRYMQSLEDSRKWRVRLAQLGLLALLIAGAAGFYWYVQWYPMQIPGLPTRTSAADVVSVALRATDTPTTARPTGTPAPPVILPPVEPTLTPLPTATAVATRMDTPVPSDMPQSTATNTVAPTSTATNTLAPTGQPSLTPNPILTWFAPTAASR